MLAAYNSCHHELNAAYLLSGLDSKKLKAAGGWAVRGGRGDGGVIARASRPFRRTSRTSLGVLNCSSNCACFELGLMMYDSLRSGGGNRESLREELHARSSDNFVFLTERVHKGS